MRASETNGFPPMLLNLLTSSYYRTTTFILGNELGFKLAKTTEDSIAHADDLFLFAESPLGLQRRLNGLDNGLFLADMVLNSAKCASFYVQAIGKEKSACLRPCELSIRGSDLRSLGSLDTFKYLGVPFSYRGKIACCQLTHQARVLRHYQVINLLASNLVKRKLEVLLKPHIPEGRTFKKPDLDGLTVVNIAFTNEDLLETVNDGKFRHYSIAEVQENHRRILGHPANFPVSHVPTIFSSRGALHPRSEARLRLLGLSKLDLTDLCLMVVRASLKAYDVFMRGAG
ncbi:unnamed protein product [Schistocephalus solidus]|uniref:Reverse transcriptase domain-containing protein n=1 Tax=Schistocephalus solidus TaxID=70667 RepID=A0A3P7D9P7_SCHSO|nr:unnamed protein product [Schistocephalus solidus]